MILYRSSISGYRICGQN